MTTNCSFYAAYDQWRVRSTMTRLHIYLAVKHLEAKGPVWLYMYYDRFTNILLTWKLLAIFSSQVKMPFY